MNLNLLVLKTNQPETLVSFYQQIGFQFSNHRHGNGPLHFAAELANFVFEIYPLPNGIHTADNTTRIGFTVPNLQATIQKLKIYGGTIKKEPAVTEWGYQALVEDPDGRKVELKEENTDANKFIIKDKFKITGRGLVMAGVIAEGQIFPGDEMIFEANGVVRRRLIAGVEGIRRTQITNPVNIGLLVKCANDEEIDELWNWKADDQLALVKNNASKRQQPQE